MTKPQQVASGMGCNGRYCGNVRLYLLGISADASNVHRSPWISDNAGHRYFWNTGEASQDLVAECPNGTAVSFAECSGKHCDNLRFECAKPLQWKVDLTGQPHVTEWFSEETQGGGRTDCPQGSVVTGVECQAVKKFCLTKCGDYCDNKRLRCRQIIPEMTGAAILGVRAVLSSSVAPVPPVETPWWKEVIASGWNATKSGWNSFLDKAGDVDSSLLRCSLGWAALLPLGWAMQNAHL
jgi:hypothetical protein